MGLASRVAHTYATCSLHVGMQNAPDAITKILQMWRANGLAVQLEWHRRHLNALALSKHIVWAVC